MVSSRCKSAGLMTASGQKRKLARLNGCPVYPRYCCKSRKSNDPKNLAKVDFWTSLLLRRYSAPLRRSVVDFGRIDMVPHVAARKTHQQL
jgi:hypothetical protein